MIPPYRPTKIVPYASPISVSLTATTPYLLSDPPLKIFQKSSRPITHRTQHRKNPTPYQSRPQRPHSPGRMQKFHKKTPKTFLFPLSSPVDTATVNAKHTYGDPAHKLNLSINCFCAPEPGAHFELLANIAPQLELPDGFKRLDLTVPSIGSPPGSPLNKTRPQKSLIVSWCCLP